MSHLFTALSNWSAIGVLKIVDYTAGGESIDLSGLNFSSTITSVIMGQVPSSQNSLGFTLTATYENGIVKIFRSTAGSPQEINSTQGLNAMIPIIIGFA